MCIRSHHSSSHHSAPRSHGLQRVLHILSDLVSSSPCLLHPSHTCFFDVPQTRGRVPLRVFMLVVPPAPNSLLPYIYRAKSLTSYKSLLNYHYFSLQYCVIFSLLISTCSFSFHFCLYIFYNSFKFTATLSGREREIAHRYLLPLHIHNLPHYQLPPQKWYIVVQLMNLHEHIINTKNL